MADSPGHRQRPRCCAPRATARCSDSARSRLGRELNSGCHNGGRNAASWRSRSSGLAGQSFSSAQTSRPSSDCPVRTGRPNSRPTRRAFERHTSAGTSRSPTATARPPLVSSKACSSSTLPPLDLARKRTTSPMTTAPDLRRLARSRPHLSTSAPLSCLGASPALRRSGGERRVRRGEREDDDRSLLAVTSSMPAENTGLQRADRAVPSVSTG